MDPDRLALLNAFLEDAEEQLGIMEQALVALESTPDDRELIGRVFRGAHTLKGSASCVGLEPFTVMTHALESVLARLRSGAIAATPPIIGDLLAGVDLLRTMAFAPKVEEQTALPPGAAPLLDRFAQLDRDASTSDRDAQAEGGGDGGTEAVVHESGPRARSLRVSTEKLDRMMNMMGELGIALERVARAIDASSRDGLERSSIARHDPSPALGHTNANGAMSATAATGGNARDAHREADKLLLELQELVVKARLVPLVPVFQSFARTVRDLAARHGKAAQLVVEGEGVELDTSIVERLRGPLTHLLRNAIDHGLESPADRAAAGKPASGCIRMSARHEAGNVVVEVSDDGAGLDLRRIAERAGSKVESLSDRDVARIVCTPGFSTASSVTDLSGRGVGMDVVKRTVEALRGSLALRSQPCKGTTVALRLPLTLAVIKGFGVTVGSDVYVIPMDSVLECVALERDHDFRAEGHGVMSLRGEPLPYLRLRHLFALRRAAPPRENVVVVQHAGERVGIAVDELLGESQTVIKPLDPLFDRVGDVSGSTVLGSGRVALILDVPSLLRAAREQAEADHAAMQPSWRSS